MAKTAEGNKFFRKGLLICILGIVFMFIFSGLQSCLLYTSISGIRNRIFDFTYFWCQNIKCMGIIQRDGRFP